MKRFECSACGLCCRLIDRSEEFMKANNIEFPYKTVDGVCEKLIDDKCSIYSKRPWFCNVENFSKWLSKKTGIKQDLIIEASKISCKELKKEFNVI